MKMCDHKECPSVLETAKNCLVPGQVSTEHEEQLQSYCRRKTGEHEPPDEEERCRDKRAQLQPFWAIFHAMLEETSFVTHSLTPRRYNPCRVLSDSRSRLQPSLSLALLFQFLTPSLSASLITPSIHLRLGLPTRLLSSGLSKVIFLHGRLSFIHTICPAHLSLVILTVVTKSVSSYR